MKIAVLPSTQLVFTAIELTILQQILQISARFQKGYHHNSLFYSHHNTMSPICMKALYHPSFLILHQGLNSKSMQHNKIDKFRKRE